MLQTPSGLQFQADRIREEILAHPRRAVAGDPEVSDLLRKWQILNDKAREAQQLENPFSPASYLHS